MIEMDFLVKTQKWISTTLFNKRTQEGFCKDNKAADLWLASHRIHRLLDTDFAEVTLWYRELSVICLMLQGNLGWSKYVEVFITMQF